MTNTDPALKALDFGSTDGLDDHFESIQDQLQATAPEDIRLQLPNLVESIRDRSVDSETVRFLIGVSFTHDYLPLDYKLERYHAPANENSNRVETVKVPVSASHGYLSLVYPPDPEFDGQALRSILLAEIERRLHTLETDPTGSVTGSRLADLWEQL
jgi:hypothetical protein